MATDERPASDPAVPQSTIETASERLETYLKNRQVSPASAEADSEDPSSARENLPPAGGDEAVGQSGDGTNSDKPGIESGDRRNAPRWIKVALALAVVMAAAEGAYIVWGFRASAVPAAPRAETSTPRDQPTQTRRVAAPAVERAPPADAADQRARRTPPAASATAPKVAPDAAQIAAPATATTGTLEVRTTPPGASVVFGGRRRGVTPLAIRDVPPGIHDIEVGGWFGSRFQRVTVRAGRTSVVEMTVPRRRSSP